MYEYEIRNGVASKNIMQIKGMKLELAQYLEDEFGQNSHWDLLKAPANLRIVVDNGRAGNARKLKSKGNAVTLAEPEI